MYAKVFTQIFDSSIAENYEVRHVFEDLLKLCDRDGVVDMTVEAISRRTNVPIEKVRFAIEELCKPDPNSRSREFEGKRLIPLDPQRAWGWEVVNYNHYRSIQDEESRRSMYREAKRKQRNGQHRLRPGKPLPGEMSAVRRSKAGDQSGVENPVYRGSVADGASG